MAGTPVAHSELEMPIGNDLCFQLGHNREINYLHKCRKVEKSLSKENHHVGETIKEPFVVTAGRWCADLIEPTSGQRGNRDGLARGHVASSGAGNLWKEGEHRGSTHCPFALF